MALTPFASPTAAAKLSDLNTLITAINAELALLDTKADVDALKARVATLEARTIPPDLSPRVEILEAKPDLAERVAVLEAAWAAEPPAPTPATDPMVLPVIPHTPADPTKVELVYDKATIYLGDMELHALRIAQHRWRLVAQLNYITVNQVQWTYDEVVDGTPDEVYAYAVKRITELAKLKPQHDAVHDRVRRMSEGAK